MAPRSDLSLQAKSPAKAQNIQGEADPDFTKEKSVSCSTKTSLSAAFVPKNFNCSTIIKAHHIKLYPVPDTSYLNTPFNPIHIHTKFPEKLTKTLEKKTKQTLSRSVNESKKQIPGSVPVMQIGTKS